MRRERIMKRWIVATALALTLAGGATGAALGASENAGCVGQFSSFFAHGGGGTHRSEIAQQFAAEAHPAGRNVYSHVAQFRGTLEECFEQT
jgi:hypothetical protein